MPPLFSNPKIKIKFFWFYLNYQKQTASDRKESEVQV